MIKKSTSDLSISTSSSIDLDAKIFQAYDPSTENREIGIILGNALVTADAHKAKEEKIHIDEDKNGSGKNGLDSFGKRQGQEGRVKEADQLNKQIQESESNADRDKIDSSGGGIPMDGGISSNAISQGQLAALQNNIAAAPLGDGGYFYSSPNPPGGGGGGGDTDQPPPNNPAGPAAPAVAVATGAGMENQNLPVTIILGPLPAAGDVTLTLGGLPPGAALTAGIDNGDNTWTLTPAELAGLEIIPPVNAGTNFVLTVTVTHTLNGASDSNVAATHVVIEGMPITPLLSVQPATGAEDTPIPLDISAALVDTDGSETLSITISGVPAGATLSAGVDNGNGSWTLTPDDLINLTITPPQDFAGNIQLTVTANAHENGHVATNSSPLPVTVEGVADAPLLGTQNISGFEDTPIAVNISAATVGAGETLSLVIAGVPAGATLSAGVDNGDGTWSLLPNDLPGLTMTPPQDYSGTVQLTVTATATENGTSASSQSVLTLQIQGVADMPTLSVQSASGGINTDIPLGIAAALTDTDGSETLSITISGLPAGSTLSAGVQNADGSWTLGADDLAGLIMTPPTNWAGNMNLTVTAIASEDGSTAQTSSFLPVSVTGALPLPTLIVQAASGLEDTPVDLDISASYGTAAPLTITIGNLPAGATLSAGTQNADGTWTLDVDDLAGLQLIPPPDWSGNLQLTVSVSVTEFGNTAQTSALMALDVAGVADTPVLGIVPATGDEGSPVALSITAALTDTDGSETLTITISDLPAGATLSAGTDNGDGTWTLTPAQLNGLQLIPPAGYSGNSSLTITATAAEDGTTASVTNSMSVSIAGNATTPQLSVQNATGAEDTPIPLDITAALTDNDGSETLVITIGNLPAGATLSAGINNGDGTWTLTPAQLAGLALIPAANWNGTATLSVTATSHENGTTADISATLDVEVTPVADPPQLTVSDSSGFEDSPVTISIAAALSEHDTAGTISITVSGLPAGAALSAGINNGDGTWTLTPAQLAGLTMTPPANWSGHATLTVTATVTDGSTTASTSAEIDIAMAGVADIPLLTVQAAIGNEDSAIPLDIQAALVDTDGSEVLSICIGNVPAGATLSAGTNNGDGTWTLTPAQLAGLTLTPPANWSGTIILSVAAATAEDGTWATSTSPLPVLVIPAADTPALNVAAASGAEDTAIPLGITAALTDASETLSITISGVPAGAILSAGIYAGNGTWTLSPADLPGLTITPPENFSGMLALQATAISTASNGDTASFTQPLNVTVTPVADAPVLTLNDAAGYEDTAIALDISALLPDTSETMTITIAGVPAGATLSAGNFSGGLWHLTPAQLSGLTITPPSNSDADFTLTVTATTQESDGSLASTSGTMDVVVKAVADTPTVSAANVSGAAGAAIALNISGALTDTDGSESLSYIIHGMPDGFALNKGINNGDNTWTLSPDDLAGLQIITPPHLNAQLNLYVQAVSHDNDGSTATSDPAGFYVRMGDYSSGYLIDLGIGVQIGGIGVGVQIGLLPPLDLFPATGGILATPGIYAKEGSSFLIADAPGLLSIPLLDGLTALVAKIQFQGIPADVTFSQGTNTGGGTWEFTLGQLNNLYMNLPADSDNDFTIVAVAKMLLGLLDITLTSTPVHVMGEADMPSLSAAIADTAEDQAVALTINGALNDNDGSETLSYLVSGMPEGFTLNKGINNGNGTWSLTPAELAGLMVIPAADYSGNATVTISAVATEREGDQAVAQTTLNFNVTAVADAPIVAPPALSGSEDQPLLLDLGIALADTDGSESISAITISGLPAGASLLGATDNGDGSWSVSPALMHGVHFIPPTNWSGDATLTITATSTETSNVNSANNSGTLHITIDAVADTPLISANNATGTQGQDIDLVLAGALTDSGEHLSAIISGLPEGALLSAGYNNGDGTWTLEGSHLAGLKITPPHDFHGDMNLSLTLYSREDNGSVAAAQMDFNVEVIADPQYDPFGDAMAGGSWLDAAAQDTGGTPEYGYPAGQNALDAIDTAHVAAVNAGQDYQQAFQGHETG